MSETIRSLMVKIGVDYSQFKTSMDNVKNQQTEIEAKFRETANAMGNWQGKSEGLAARVSSLNEKIRLQRQLLDELKSKIDAAKTAGEQNSEATKKLESQYIKASGTLDKMEGELGQYQDALYKTATAEGKTGAEAQEMGGKLKAAEANASGLKNQLKEFATSSMGSMLTVAGGIALAKQAIQALSQLISEAAQWADDLVPLSQKLSLTTQELQGLQYAAKFVEVDVETMGGAMRRLTKSMGEAASGNKDLNSVFKDQLGINVELNGQLRDKNDVFAEAINALGKMTNETERDVLAQKLFGKSAAELNPLIEAGGDALKRYGAEANDMGAVVDRGAIKKLTALQDEFDKTQSIADTAGKHFAASMAPVSKFFDNLWRSAIKAIDPIMQYNTAIYNTAMAQGATAEQAQKLVDNNNSLNEAYAVMGVSQEVFFGKLKELTQFYIDQSIPADEAKKKAIEDLANGMDLAAVKTDALKQKQAEMSDAINTQLADYTAASDEYYTKLEETTKKYIEQMGGIFGEFPAKLDTKKKELEKIGKEILKEQENEIKGFQAWSDALAALGKRGVDDGLIAQLRDLGVKALPHIQALNSMTDTQLTAWKANMGTISGLARKEAVKELEPLKKEMDEKLAALNAGIKAWDDAFKTSGKALGDGVASGITASTPAIRKAAVDAIKEALRAVNSYTEKGSPSRLFAREAGVPIGQGIGAGTITGLKSFIPKINNEIGNLKSVLPDMPGSIGSVSSAMTNISATGTGAPAASVAPGGDIYLSTNMVFDGKVISTMTQKISKELATQSDMASLSGGLT
jgi:hypothetical protein